MSAQSSEGADPNLTPILDLVFQLITFFMLVTNFKGALMDLSLKLPVLGSARPLEWAGKFEPLVLNVNPEGRVEVFGQTVQVDAFIAREAKLLKVQMEALGMPPAGEDGFPVPVIIRADRTVPFATVNKVIKTCQEQGYLQFSLSAMNREEGG